MGFPKLPREKESALCVFILEFKFRFEIQWDPELQNALLMPCHGAINFTIIIAIVHL